MPEESPSVSALCLTIAGQSVNLEITNPAIYNVLQQRYQGFIGAGSSPITVQLKVLPNDIEESQTQPANSWPEVMFENNEARLVFSNGEGVFDFHSGHGKLICARPRGIETIDYYLRVVFALLAYRAGGLLFHAAGIERAGQAFLFFGPSGSGKTTISRARQGIRVLNDDLVVLLPDNGAWIVYSTPFWNPKQLKPEPANALLAALFWLVQDRTVQLVSIDKARAIGQLLACVPVLAAHAEFLPELIQRCGDIVHKLPVFALHFLPDDRFWDEIERAGLTAAG